MRINKILSADNPPQITGENVLELSFFNHSERNITVGNIVRM